MFIFLTIIYAVTVLLHIACFQHFLCSNCSQTVSIQKDQAVQDFQWKGRNVSTYQCSILFKNIGSFNKKS